MKSLLTIMAGGTALASFFLLVAAAALVLVVVPAGLGILTLELERFERRLRHPFASAMRAKLLPTPEND